jgi:anti-sigma factor RsiW
MAMLGCLWNRPRLERLVDGALGPRMERMAASHTSRCVGCRDEVERLRRLQALVRGVETPVANPDWSGFWPAVRVRIAAEHPAPARDPWWLPYWKPLWGHPRVALGGLVVSSLAVALVLWPSAETTKAAMAAPVQVQDVSTTDPNRSVMVYSNPDDDVTVIWVFNPIEQDEQS